MGGGFDGEEEDFIGSWPAKAGSSSFPKPNSKIPTHKLIAGSKFSLRGKFRRASRMNRLRFQWKSVYLGIVSTRKVIAGSKS